MPPGLRSMTIPATKLSPIGREDVFRACDALLRDGVKVTGDTVRGYLGRGSPNTIHPLISEWWRELSVNMTRDETRPDVPDAVWQATNKLWDTALESATSEAQRALQATERALFAREQDAERRIAEAATVREAADAKLVEMQRMLDVAGDRSDRIAAERTEAQSALRASVARVETLDRELADAKRMLTVVRADYESERERTEQRHTKDCAAWAKEKAEIHDAAERDRDRLMLDLDAARQATKDVQRKIDDLDRQNRDASSAHASRVLELTLRADAAEARHATVLREVERISAELQSARATSQSAETEADQLRAERDQLHGQVHALNVQCADLLSRVVVDPDETAALRTFRAMSPAARAKWLQQRRT